MSISRVTKAEVGLLGERISVLWLIKRGFTIIERNLNLYKCNYKKIGEIDILAEKGGVVHVFEVRTRYTNLNHMDDVSYGTALKLFIGHRKLSSLMNLLRAFRSHLLADKWGIESDFYVTRENKVIPAQYLYKKVGSVSIKCQIITVSIDRKLDVIRETAEYGQYSKFDDLSSLLELNSDPGPNRLRINSVDLKIAQQLMSAQIE